MQSPRRAAEVVSTEAVPDGPRPIVVKARRGPVECAVAGDGPAILALHGAMGGHDQAWLLARTIGAPGFRYVALSRPGYLGTPLEVARTPEEQADLYREVLDALGIRDVLVMAVSGGGPSALQFAASHRDRCRGAVIVSSVCVRNEGRLPLAWHVMKLTARCEPLVALMRRKVARDPERAARRSIPDPALRARTVRDPEAGPLLLALQLSTLDRMRQRLPGTESDIATTFGELSLPLERIDVPVLVVHGTADRVAAFAQARRMVERIPGAELLAVEGGDHVTIFTHRGVVRERVVKFLHEHAALGGEP